MLDEKVIGFAENGVYVITAEHDETDNSKELPKNIPVFAGGSFDGIYANGDAGFIVCLNDCKKTDIISYIKILEDGGYRKKAENRIFDNLFYTYENGESYINVYYINALKTVKLIAEPYYEYELNTDEINIVKPAIIASSVCDRNFYIRLPDNSIVIVDGGWRAEDWSLHDYRELLNGMYEEIREILGGSEIIKVPLWIITHAHIDHTRAIEYLHTLQIAEKIKIERILYNFPAQSHIVDEEEPTAEQLSEMRENIEKWHSNAGKDYPYEKIFYNCPFRIYDPYKYEITLRSIFGKYGAAQIKAHSGMKLNLSGVTFEVLHTPEDDMPASFKNRNDLSIIIKMSYQGSSMLWLGDMCEIPSDSCVKMYGDFLKSDAMQVSHHGWGAATPEFYNAVKPKVLFWNNSEFGYKYADKYQGYGKTKISTDLYNMSCVKKNFFCNRIRMSYAYLPIKISDSKNIKSDCRIALSAVSDRTFMLRLPNGKLMVFGGGWREAIWNELDRKTLINKLYEEMQMLSESSKVVVDTWIITNSYKQNNRFIECLKDFDIDKNLEIERVICNFPSAERIAGDIANGDTAKYQKLITNKIKELNAELIIAESGMTLETSGVKLQVLYAPNEEKYESIADTSLVIRILYGDSRIIFTGDMTDRISEKLISDFGEDLKCDAVQIARQGLNNCGLTEFYRLCNAKLQLWNNSEYGFRFFGKREGYKKSKSSTEIFELENCKLNAFCDQVKPQIFNIPLSDDQLENNV